MLAVDFDFVTNNPARSEVEAVDPVTHLLREAQERESLGRTNDNCLVADQIAFREDHLSEVSMLSTS